MAGKAGGDEEMISAINMTPFVDVVLVLLIIFMVTARLMVSPSIPVELPKAGSGEETKASPVSITITRSKETRKVLFFLNGQKVAASQIRDALIERIKKAGKKNIQVVIAADKDIAYGRIIWVLDTVRRLGIEQYAFNIDPEQATEPAK